MTVQPGLFGKMPAHGDFVRRGWDDATVDALDAWCTGAVALLADTADDGACWCGWVPAGMLGPMPLHVAVARSQDRAGRDFVLVVGVAGPGAWGHAQAADAALEVVVRGALYGDQDADATLAAVTATVIDASSDDDPAETRWWRNGALVADTMVDAALLARLLRAQAVA